MKNGISSICLTLVASVVIVAPVWARIITVEVTGVVDIIRPSSGFDLDGSINLGSVMNGSCIYDTEATPQESDWNFIYPIISISATLGNYTFTHNPTSLDDARIRVGYDGGHIYSVWSVADVYGDIIVGGVLQPFDNDVGRCSLNPFMKLGISSGEPDPGPPYNLPNPFPDFSAFDMYKEFTILIWHGSSNRFDIQGEITSLTVVPEPGTYYVDGDAVGFNDGSSWEDAFNYLQDALDVAVSGDEIWVAESIYTPDEDSGHPGGTGDRKAAFQLKNGVAIYGGYAGFSEPDANVRDVELYETILSGDLNGDDGPDFANNDENSYHVVTGSGSNKTAVLDGFTVIGGNTKGSNDRGGGMYIDNGSPTIMNCTFKGNLSTRWGGGMYSYHGSSKPTLVNCMFIGNSAKWGGGMCSHYGWATLINCVFSGNSAREHGGGMYNRAGSTPKLINCVFHGNSAGHGGGMYNWTGSNPKFTNCTFSGNSATWGGGIGNEGSSDLRLTNCVLWGNTANTGSQIALGLRGDLRISYCDLQGGQAAIYFEDGSINWGHGNLETDPCFVDANNGDYHLLAGSPCIDAGDNTAVPADIHDLDGDGNTTEPIPWDLDGNPRIVDGNNDGVAVVDMGAYEYEAMVSCFGVNHVKLETKAGKKGNKVDIKGTFSPALPIDFAVDDVAYIIDDGQGNVLAFLIPAGSFKVDGKPGKQKFKFHSPKGSQPDIKAKFDFDKCKFELKAKRVQGIDEITSTTLAIELWAGANLVEEVVQVQVKPKHLEYKRKPKLSCCPKCKGIALLEVTSTDPFTGDEYVLLFEPDPGKEKLKRKTVVDDGVNGRVKIDTSCSKPIEVGDVFGVYTVTDLIKIFDDWPDDENDE